MFSFLPAQNWEILILKIGENRIRSWIWWAHQIWIISAMKLQDYSRRKQNVCFDVLDIPEKLLHFLLRKKSTYLATISESFPISVKITSCEEKKVFSTQKIKFIYADTTPSWLKGVIKSKNSTFLYFLTIQISNYIPIGT